MATDKRTDACFRLLCYTLIFLAYKKWQKHEKKSPQKRFFLPFFFATCQCGCYNVFKKFLPTKLLSKVAHNWPKHFISQSSPAHSPELIFHIINMSQDTSVSLSVICCVLPQCRRKVQKSGGGGEYLEIRKKGFLFGTAKVWCKCPPSTTAPPALVLLNKWFTQGCEIFILCYVLTWTH